MEYGEGFHQRNVFEKLRRNTLVKVKTKQKAHLTTNEMRLLLF